MKNRFNILFVMALVLTGVVGLQAQTDSPSDSTTDDLVAVEKVALDYLTSGPTGDVERLKNAFHSSARLQFVDDNEYNEWDGQDYVNGRKPGKKSECQYRVLSIDCAGSAAMAKVELDYGKTRFIDYLSMLKIDGRWWIVNKIFHAERGVQ